MLCNLVNKYRSFGDHPASMFLKKILSKGSDFQYVSPKGWLVCGKLHGIILKKMHL